MKIPFNKPFLTGKELENIKSAYANGQLAGDGIFSKQCQNLINKLFNANDSLLTHSCTAALEMSAILCDIQPGDEIIMPSYTFVSTANAFVLRGAVPVFTDIRGDTLNIDEEKISNLITKKTKAIVPVHYAGMSCDMESLSKLAKNYDLYLIEDAAQAIGSTFDNQPLGSFGDLSTVSFHETKNIISGEGGALLINNPKFQDRAEIIREKGTNRSLFFKGLVDKYTWVDIGSSFLPGELTAAFLLAQLEMTDTINLKRLQIWEQYHQRLEDLEKKGLLRRPVIPKKVQHNAHLYYILTNSEQSRDEFIRFMSSRNISCVFHYQPLHNTTYGISAGKSIGELPITDSVSKRLVRLPLWLGIEEHIDYIIDCVYDFFEKQNSN